MGTRSLIARSRVIDRRIFLLGAAFTALPEQVSNEVLVAKSANAADAEIAELPVPALIGAWSPVMAGAAVAINVALLPGGNVIAWQDAGTDLRPQPDKTLAYRIPTQPGQYPTASNWVPIPNNQVNLFCAGQTLLPNGRVFVVGGQSGGYYF